MRTHIITGFVEQLLQDWTENTITQYAVTRLQCRTKIEAMMVQRPGRQITRGAAKSQQCGKYCLQYSTFAFERP